MSETKIDELQILEPNYVIRYQVIGKGDHIHTYAQRPLSFFGKIELFSLLGGTISDAMKQSDFSAMEFLGQTENLKEPDSLIQVIMQLVEFAPDLLKDTYCLALAVPKGEREYIKTLMELPEDEGGISDQDGIEILDTFVEQNWEAMQDFFVAKVMPLIQKISSKAQDTASLKPLNRTQRRTRKR